MLRWDRPSPQKSQLLPELGSQQALLSSGSRAPGSSRENRSVCLAPRRGLLGRQRARGSENSGRIFRFQSQVMNTDFLGTG